MISPDYQRTEILFSQYDLRSSIDNTKKTLLETAETVPITKETSDEDIDSLAKQLAKKFVIKVPELREADTYTSSEERTLDVSHDFNRVIFDRGKPFYKAFNAVVFHIPYIGDKEFFYMRANTYSYNPPRAEIKDGEIVIAILVEGEDVTPDQIKSAFEGELSSIKQGLDWIAQDISPLRADQLLEDAKAALIRKREKLNSNAELLKQIGFKTQSAPQITPTAAVDEMLENPEIQTQGFQYDFFISHASEDKESIARPLFNALSGKYRVWFDEAELKIGDSLSKKIREGLANCRYGIVILSPDFFAKKWTAHELQALTVRQVESGPGIILPIWKNIDKSFLEKNYPDLMDIKAAKFSDGIAKIVRQIESLYNNTV